jgi:hypothetical protein
LRQKSNLTCCCWIYHFLMAAQGWVWPVSVPLCFLHLLMLALRGELIRALLTLLCCCCLQTTPRSSLAVATHSTCR